MKKIKIKKYIAVLCAVLIIISASPIAVFAIDNEKEMIIEINEWDEYVRTSSMTTDELLLEGFSENEISAIRNFDFEKAIRDRATLSDEDLFALGYKRNEIIELRAVAKMEKIPYEVLKTIATSTMTTKLEYIGNGSYLAGGSTMYYVDLKFSWKWSKTPYFLLEDMVAIAFNSSTGNQFSYVVVPNYNVRCDLIKLPTSTTAVSGRTQIENWVFSTDKANTISAGFAVGSKNVNGTPELFAPSGYGTFRLTNRSNKAMLRIDAAYGHTTINMTPNFGVDLSGPVASIDFKLGMDEQHCTGEFYEDFTISRSRIYHGTVYGKNGTGGLAA